MSQNGKMSQNYISKVHLKGYKSIQDVEIDLLPGMNIIIGPNGSGKTNFLDYIDRSIKGELRDVSVETIGQLSFKIDDENYLHESKFEEVEHDNPKDKIPFMREFKSKLHSLELIPNKSLELIPNKSLVSYLWRSAVFFQKISFKVPYILLGNNSSESIKYHHANDEIYSLSSGIDVFDSIFNLKLKELIRQKLKNLLKNKKLDNSKIAKEFISSFKIDTLQPKLATFTPIQDLKIAESLRIDSFQNNDIIFSNFRFEYKVNHSWIPWDFLSDGTKRLFYIISEVLSGEKGIYLIDEPELGLHPHQLLKLMDFLQQEASGGKQIIIATHSPQVLNYLKMKDLDRLILSKYDKEKGTQLFRLDEERKRAAIEYMETKGLYLSDFWVYSDLEAEEDAEWL